VEEEWQGICHLSGKDHELIQEATAVIHRDSVFGGIKLGQVS
jgi:hypothetical protein